ncbi:cysteine--tRNA ligase [Chloroflexota bacterium]
MKIFNTLSGQKEDFSPQGDVVKMYVCGVTPYDDAHLGHAMSYIIFDVIRRYLKFGGYKIKFAQNVTDIDDKIIARANQRGISTHELAEGFTKSYFDDMEALNVQLADVNPRATEEIPQMIDVIQGLIDRDYAYTAEGSVYFRVRNVPDYGKLSHRSLNSMRTGAGAETGAEKEDPMDFVLWKAAKPDEPSWNSPWGPGRPGWHIECSTMSLTYLGDTIDIHGGGQDLVFPHHENEIAQSESFTGIKPFVKYWLHNGLVQMGGEKMSKSLGNLITIKEAVKRYGADALRIFVLSSHYRSPLTYSDEVVEAAERGVKRLLRVISRDDPASGKGEVLECEPFRKQFVEAMDDDFNTPQALATLFDLAREINQAADSGISFSDARSIMLELARDILGMKLEVSEFISEPDPETQLRINQLIEERNRLRQAKEWQKADEIRDKLAEMGVILEDAPQGTRAIWK